MADSISGCDLYSNIFYDVTLCSLLDSHPSLPGKWLIGGSRICKLDLAFVTNLACMFKSQIQVNEFQVRHKHKNTGLSGGDL